MQTQTHYSSEEILHLLEKMDMTELDVRKMVVEGYEMLYRKFYDELIQAELRAFEADPSVPLAMNIVIDGHIYGSVEPEDRYNHKDLDELEQEQFRQLWRHINNDQRYLVLLRNKVPIWIDNGLPEIKLEWA